MEWYAYQGLAMKLYQLRVNGQESHTGILEDDTEQNQSLSTSLGDCRCCCYYGVVVGGGACLSARHVITALTLDAQGRIFRPRSSLRAGNLDASTSIWS